MDCTISNHNVRTFCSALCAMSKIGKDLYIQFDPLDGLILRTLNDAKSAFCEFYWKPSFFEKCTAPPLRKRSQDEHGFKCRIPMRAMAPIWKPRKGVTSLIIRNEWSSQQEYLCFHFELEREFDVFQVVHRVGVVDAESVHAIKDRKGSSEIVSMPRFLLRMMEPLKTASELAMTVNNVTRIVTMASYYHEAQQQGNVILQNKSATRLKSETCAGAHEFEEFLFKDHHAHDTDNDSPTNVNEEVTLVCTLREPKAMLQFCASASEEDLRVKLIFHWGGKPLVLETATSTFEAELVMATLDHHLLRSPTIPQQGQ